MGPAGAFPSQCQFPSSHLMPSSSAGGLGGPGGGAPVGATAGFGASACDTPVAHKTLRKRATAATIIVERAVVIEFSFVRPWRRAASERTRRARRWDLF